MDWLSTINYDMSHDNGRLEVLQHMVSIDRKHIGVDSCELFILLLFVLLDVWQKTTLLNIVELFIGLKLALGGKGVHAVLTVSQIELVLDIGSYFIILGSCLRLV